MKKIVAVPRFVMMLVGLFAIAGAAYAGPYPDHPVKILVPYAAGGTTDLVARLVAQELQVALKQPFVVENRPGAVGLIAHREILRSSNDGYTLMVSGSGPLSIMPHLHANLGYDPAHAFTPIKLISSSPMVLVVNPQVKANTVAELVQEAKNEGGKMSYGSWGAGSPSHLAAEIFRADAGFPAIHVPFKGSSEAIANLLGGHIDMLFEVIFVALPEIKAGKFKAIAITTPERSAFLPDTPTMVESGYPKMVLTTWAAMVGPPGMSPQIADTLSKVLDKSLAKKSFQEKLLAQGALAEGGSPQRLSEFLGAQLDLMGKAVNLAGIKPQ
jgi:tripartite-type tricarboxylate transporter receptor subunit TctC